MAQPFHFQSISLPLTGAADAASAVAVAAVGKITCACRHRRCTTTGSAAGVAPVQRAGTSFVTRGFGLSGRGPVDGVSTVEDRQRA